MKHIRSMLSIVSVVLICMCTGCGFFGPQRYECDVENVKAVSIIRIDEIVEGEYTVLSEINDEDIYVFVQQLEAVSHVVNWGEPTTFFIGDIVIMIDYNNGDHDMIHWYAQSFYRSDSYQSGFFFFDENEFYTLISDYWTVSKEEYPDIWEMLESGKTN